MSTDSGSATNTAPPGGILESPPAWNAGAVGGVVGPLYTPPSNKPLLPGHVCTPFTVVGWLQAAALPPAPLAQS